MTNENIPPGLRCVRCGRPMVARGEPVPEGHAQHVGRGLCEADYASVWRAGGLNAFPKVRTPAMPREAFLEAYSALKREGRTTREIADALGMTVNMVNLARHRYGLSKKLERPREPRSQLDNKELRRLRLMVGLA